MSEVRDHFYAEAMSSERWIVDAAARRIESISGVGWSEASRVTGSLTFIASDAFEDRRRTIEERLRAALTTDASAIVDAVRAMHRPLDVRIVSKARYVESESSSNLDSRIIVAISAGSAAIVSRPKTLDRDLEALRQASASKRSDETVDAREFPIVWRRGSGAVLLHEAIGHAAERDAPPIAWPSWLDVVDDPTADGLGTMTFDDVGRATRPAKLMRESPNALRRESFRDLPMPRMTNLVVTATAAAPLPDPRIEISLVAGGSYDLLTDVASLSIAAAAVVDGLSVRSLSPFQIRIARKTLAARLLGATGPSTPYPGVICFDEGQRIPVGSVSPDLVTAPFEDR